METADMHILREECRNYNRIPEKSIAVRAAHGLWLVVRVNKKAMITSGSMQSWLSVSIWLFLLSCLIQAHSTAYTVFNAVLFCLDLLCFQKDFL